MLFHVLCFLRCFCRSGFLVRLVIFSFATYVSCLQILSQNSIIEFCGYDINPPSCGIIIITILYVCVLTAFTADKGLFSLPT